MVTHDVLSTSNSTKLERLSCREAPDRGCCKLALHGRAVAQCKTVPDLLQLQAGASAEQ